jgi:hypothetical protein
VSTSGIEAYVPGSVILPFARLKTIKYNNFDVPVLFMVSWSDRRAQRQFIREESAENNL